MELFFDFASLKLKIIVGAMNQFEAAEGAKDQNTGFALFGQTDQSRLLFISTAGFTMFLISFLSWCQ